MSPSDCFALSVIAAKGLKALGLPVAGARHAGESVAVGFNTPRGAVGVVAVPPGQNVQALITRIQRIRQNDLGKDGFK